MRARIAGAVEQLGVLGQPGEAERLQAGLARAEHLALAAQLEVDLGELEAVAVVGQRAQPGRLLGPEQQAQRLVRAAADPPAQLVQLRDPVALGVLDEHHRGVGDVDADLDHRRGDEHVGAARGERRHRLLLLARAHLAVQQHDAEVAQLAGPQPLELGRRGARLQRLGLLHQRADDERLAAGAQLLADALVGPRALALGGADVGVDRPPAGGQLAQHGHVEVAVGGQRERARDRRRGHVQHVRREPGRRLAVQRAALVDAEAVLLVDDRDREPVELDRLLDQRVRADQQLQLAAWRACRAGRRGRAAGVEPVSSAACTSSPGISVWSVAKCCSASVSVGAISAAWRARLDRAQHRVERDDGLARARPRPSAAAASAARAARSSSIAAIARALVARRRERQRVAQPARGQLARRRRAPPPARASRRRARRRSSAICSSSSSSKASRRRPPSWSPKWAASQRRRAVGQPLERRAAARAAARARRARAPRCSRDEREDLRRGEPVGGRVGGDVAVGRASASPVGGVELDAEAVAAPGTCRAAAAACPGRYLRSSHGWLKNVDLHRAGLVGDDGLDERLHPPPAHRAAT